MIEPVEPHEDQAVGQFIERVVRISVDATAPEKQAFLANIRANLAAWEQNPQAALHLKWVEDGMLAGVVMVKAFWNLCHLFVAPGHQGRGIGKALMGAAIGQCRGRSGRPYIRLNAARNAIGFYERLGFTLVPDAPAPFAGVQYERLLGAGLQDFPTLTTPRLTIRPLQEADLPDLLKVNGDPEVTRYLPYQPWQSLEDAHAWRLRMATLESAGAARQLVLVANESGRAIATLLLFHLDEADATIELGYALGRAHWGQGLMKEALPAVCAHVLGPMRLNRIDAHVEHANAASHALLQRLGFSNSGTTPDLCSYSLLAISCRS